MKPGYSKFLPVLALVEFIAMAAISLALGPVAFYRALGILGGAHGLAMAWSGNIPVGIEGKEPSFYLTGASAVIAGLLVAVAGGALAWFAPGAACFFSEGRACR